MFELVIVLHGERRDAYLPVFKSMKEEDLYTWFENHPEFHDEDYKIFKTIREHGNG